MSLKYYIKIKEGVKKEEIEESDLKVLGDTFAKVDVRMKVIDKLGFYPYSVWYPKSYGEYDPYVREYVQHPYLQKQVKRGATAWLGKSVQSRQAIRISFLHPKMSERVFKIWGREGFIVYNPFLGYKIDPLIANSLGMNYIGADIDPNVVKLNEEFYLKYKDRFAKPGTWAKFYVQDAMVMDKTETNSVDLIFTSPPYWGAEVYPWEDAREMSKAPSYKEFLDMMAAACRQMYRVLRPNRFAVINIGDTRRGGEFYPLHADMINLMRDAGFKVWDTVIFVNRSPFMMHLRECYEKQITRKIHEYVLIFKKE